MKINGDVCKVIPGYSRYVISESGRIYRTVPSNSKEKQKLEDNPKENYVRENTIQYYNQRVRGRWSQIGLINDKGKFVTAAAEKLVCSAFDLWPDKKHKYVIDFKDGDTTNFSVDNLIISKARPNNSKLNDEQVREIKKLISKKTPLRHIAKHYGVSDMQICRIKSGENWRKGGRKVPPPKAPIEIEDGRIRRLIASFESSPIDDGIRKPFDIKRNNFEEEFKIIGVTNGYRFKKAHHNISRAHAMVFKLNSYFFNDDIARKVEDKNKEKQQQQLKKKRKSKKPEIIVID